MATVTPREASDAIIRPSDLAVLRRDLAGRVVAPDDPDYDEARKVWNGAVDKRPAVIVRCDGPDDVARTIEFARSQELPLAVRAGGHNIAGKSLCDDGVVIDLSPMKAIQVDPERRVARVGAGLTLGEFDAATQAFGLATTMGVNSDTGLAGLTLGGGFGKLGRKHGLSADNLISAEIVTAGGSLLRVSADEAADLFWGVRGGGGNFGVVTAFEFRLHPIGPEIARTSLTYNFKDARVALQLYNELASKAPDEVSADAVMLTGPAGEPLFSVSVCYMGPTDEGNRVLDRLLAPLRQRVRPVEEQSGVLPYLEIQSASDAIFPRGQRYYWKAHFLRRIPNGAIDVLLDRFPASPSPRSIYVFQHVGGAIARVPAGATAYVNRDALYDSFPIAIWDSPEDDAANIAWARTLWSELRPFATGGVYVNTLGEEGDDRVRAAYGENYARLAALKARYDPANVFRLNQNVSPGSGSEPRG